MGADETAPKVRVWETFRGNEWENKGEEVRGLATGAGAGAAAAFPVRVLGAKAYFVERGSCEFFLFSFGLSYFPSRRRPLPKTPADLLPSSLSLSVSAAAVDSLA